MSFSHLGLSDKVLAAVAATGYTTPTPIQEQAIPHVLARRDVLGIAQTGTGKTAAFALPILNRLAANRKPLEKKSPRVLVLSPTRELSGQILDSFRTYGRYMRLQTALVIGGVPMGRQVRDLMNGLDVRLPDTEIAQALERLVSLDREVKLISRDIVAIDLRLPDRVTVKLSPAAAQARADALKDKKPAKKGGNA